MHSRELELLIQEYRNAATNEEKLIRRKLEAIASLCADCKNDEFVFANEITVEFCRLIRLLKEQHAKEPTRALRKSEVDAFVVRDREEALPYRFDGELLTAFSEYLRDKYETDGKPTPATIKDYVARVQTFSTIYLWTIPRIAEIGRRENGLAGPCPTLFVYKHLELILACFDTKVNGKVNKQRSNIRSALSKLNEFKRAKESQ